MELKSVGLGNYGSNILTVGLSEEDRYSPSSYIPVPKDGAVKDDVLINISLKKK